MVKKFKMLFSSLTKLLVKMQVLVSYFICVNLHGGESIERKKAFREKDREGNNSILESEKVLEYWDWKSLQEEGQPKHDRYRKSIKSLLFTN